MGNVFSLYSIWVISHFSVLDLVKLEHTIRKEKQPASINNSSSSIDTTCEQATISTTQTPIGTNPQASDMAVTLVLIQNANGDLHFSECHLLMQQVRDLMITGCNPWFKRSFFRRSWCWDALIAPAAVAENVQAVQSRMLADHNRPHHY